MLELSAPSKAMTPTVHVRLRRTKAGESSLLRKLVFVARAAE